MNNPLLKGVFSNRSDDWATPDVIYNYLNRTYETPKEHWFDPCPLRALENGYNGLEDNWLEKRRIFINPPYSNIKDFVEKAIETHDEQSRYSIIVFLIPARTDTQYYRMLFEYGCEFTFIEGRLKFSNSKYSSTFPSVLVKLIGGQNQIRYLHKLDLHKKWNRRNRSGK